VVGGALRSRRLEETRNKTDLMKEWLRNRRKSEMDHYAELKQK